MGSWRWGYNGNAQKWQAQVMPVESFSFSNLDLNVSLDEVVLLRTTSVVLLKAVRMVIPELWNNWERRSWQRYSQAWLESNWKPHILFKSINLNGAIKQLNSQRRKWSELPCHRRQSKQHHSRKQQLNHLQFESLHFEISHPQTAILGPNSSNLATRKKK